MTASRLAAPMRLLTAAPLLTVALLTLAAMPLRAAEFVPVEDECNGRNVVIQGPIEPGDHQRFLDFMAHHVAGGDLPAVQDPEVLWTVELDSPGGDLEEAMRMGRFLRAAFATTEVAYRYARRPDGVWDFARSGELSCLDGRGRLSGCHRDLVEARCTGACLLIWLGGAARHANEGRLGVHGLGSSGAVAGYLAEMGVPDPWIRRITRGADAEDGWLSWSDRHEMSAPAAPLESLVADCPPALSREESFESVAAEDPARRSRLMDRAEAHRSCRRGRLAEARLEVVARLARRLETRSPSLALDGG